MNKHRTDSARYELTATAEILGPDGNLVRSTTSASLIDMTDGIRMKTTGLNTQSDFIIIGQQGWNLAAGQWYAMPADQLKASLDGVQADRYVFDRDAADFECAGETDFEGRRHTGFGFSQVVGTLETRATAYFDPSTSLPTAVISTGEISGYKVVVTTRYRFDDGIRIEPPE